MRPIVTNRVAWSVGLSVTLVSPTKTAAPIEMPFGSRTRVSPRNHVLDGGPDPPMGTGKGASHCTVYRHSVVPCAKTAEPIEMSFGLWARMGPRNRVRWGPAVLRDIATATNFWDAICLLYLDLLAITLVV